MFGLKGRFFQPRPCGLGIEATRSLEPVRLVQVSEQSRANGPLRAAVSANLLFPRPYGLGWCVGKYTSQRGASPLQVQVLGPVTERKGIHREVGSEATGGEPSVRSKTNSIRPGGGGEPAS